jgi:hypothetical protein
MRVEEVEAAGQYFDKGENRERLVRGIHDLAA